MIARAALALLLLSSPALARMGGSVDAPEMASGAIGPMGPPGAKGDKGDAGPAGQSGPAGATGPVGPGGATGPAGATGAAGAKGDLGPAGSTGATGLTGPKASQFVCTATLTDTQVLGANLVVKEKSGIACAGVLTTDILEVYPTALPTGVAVHHALPSGANAIRVVYMLPAVTLLTNYSIPLSVYSVNR